MSTKNSAGVSKQSLRAGKARTLASTGTATKQVGIWIRVSTEDQAKGESPQHHEARARMYAASKGWEVVRLYNLSGFSGKTVMDHPETQAMLSDVEAGRIEALIFSKLARLARNTRELLDFAEYFKRHEADLVSLQESIDTSSPAGRFFYTLIAGMAQWEREEIADRVAASVKVRAALGKPLGGAAPFGFRWENKALVPDEREAPVLRHLFDLFREHRRLKTVARMLNESGFRTRSGKGFSDTTLRRLLTDPVMKGLRRANHTRSTGDKKHWVPKPEEEWIITPVPGIVPEDLWAECNAIIEARAQGARPAKRARHLFAGRTVCECGTKMYVPSNTPKYVCSRCRLKIPVELLERLYAERLKSFSLSPEETASYLEQGDEVLSSKRALLAALLEERDRLRSESEKLYRLYLDGGVSVRGFSEKNKPLEGRLEALEAEIPRLQGEIDFLAIERLSGEEILGRARDLFGQWEELPVEEKRDLVEVLLHRIVVGKDQVSFELAYDPAPPPPPNVAKRQHGLRGSSPPRG